MRILVIGSGLMGPAAAYNAMLDEAVDQVTVCDLSDDQLEACRDRLRGMPGADKVVFRKLDMNDRTESIAVMKDHGAGVAALPRAASMIALPLALEAGMPVMDLTRVPDDALVRLDGPLYSRFGRLRHSGLRPGAGTHRDHGAPPGRRIGPDRRTPHTVRGHPGASFAAPGVQDRLWRPPPAPARIHGPGPWSTGASWTSPRYSEPETAVFEGVGECEAWHEGFMPWLLEVDALKGLRAGTQKTVRWPGYSAKVTVLRELGLLSEEPMDVDGVSVIPKHVVDAVLYPSVKMAPEDRDITAYRVTVIGEKDGRAAARSAEMIDRYDEQTGFTSMARTTAFTAAIAARMAARGDLPHPGGPFVTPEQAIYGDSYHTLIDELDRMNVRFRMSGSG